MEAVCGNCLLVVVMEQRLAAYRHINGIITGGNMRHEEEITENEPILFFSCCVFPSSSFAPLGLYQAHLPRLMRALNTCAYNVDIKGVTHRIKMIHTHDTYLYHRMIPIEPYLAACGIPKYFAAEIKSGVRVMHPYQFQQRSFNSPMESSSNPRYARARPSATTPQHELFGPSLDHGPTQ